MINSHAFNGCAGSAVKATLGVASFLSGRLNVGLTANSPCSAGSARTAIKGKPFLFLLLRVERCRQKNSNLAPVGVPRSLTPRFAGLFSSAAPSFESLIAIRLYGFASSDALYAYPENGGSRTAGAPLDWGKARTATGSWESQRH